MIHHFIQQGAIGDKLITGLTPNYLTAQLKQHPLLHLHLHKNNTEIQNRFIDVLSRIPSKSDRPGYIYGFRNKKTYNSRDTKYEIKLGRTSKQIPQNRIFEWQKTDMHEYVQIFTVRSEYNFKLELLVHLLFAYARKTLIINGKKRIEWFEFDEKVATAAIANQLNLLMEKIHEKYIEKLTHLQPIPSTQINYDGLIQSIMGRYVSHKKESGIVMFGLPRTGKSLVRSILLQHQITVIPNKNRLLLVSKDNSRRDNLFIEISTINEQMDSSKQLEQYFTKCLELCHPSLFAILVVKQSDIESSTMIGVIQALNCLQRYVKVGDSLLVVVTKSSRNYSKSDIMESINDNQKYISKKHCQLLKNSQYITIKTPQSQGTYLSNNQSLQIRKTVINYFANQKEKFMQLQPKLQPNVLPICYEVIQLSYEVLQEVYAKAFTQQYLQFVEEEDQLDYINATRSLVQQIKLPQKQTLLHVYTTMTKIAVHLNLSQKNKLQSHLYVFCQLCYNQTLVRSNIFQGMLQTINQKIDTIIQSYNKKLTDSVQQFKLSICDYTDTGNNESVPILKQIMQVDTLKEITNILKQIVGKQSSSSKKQPKRLAQSINSLVQIIEEIGKLTAKGLRLISADSRIRQAIYYALKNVPRKQTKEEAL